MPSVDINRLTSRSVSGLIRLAQYVHPTHTLEDMSAPGYWNAAWSALPKSTFLDIIAQADGVGDRASALVLSSSEKLGVVVGQAVRLDSGHFVQAGLGAQPRTFQDKLREYLSIRDFGAIMDGTSHTLAEGYSTLSAAQAAYPFAHSLDMEVDLAAAQAAVYAARDQGGGVVYVPQGTAIFSAPPGYSTSPSTIRICSLDLGVDNVLLVGEGDASHIKLREGGVYGAIQMVQRPLVNGLPAIERSGIIGLQVDGSYDQSTGSFSIGQPLVYAVGTVDCLFDDFWFHSSSHYTLAMQNGGHVGTRVTRGFLEKSNQDGIDLKNNESRNAGIVFDDLTFSKCGRGVSPSAPFACLDIDSFGVTVSNIHVLDFPEDEGATVQAGVRLKQGIAGDKLDRGDGALYANVSNVTVVRQPAATTGDSAIACNTAFATVHGAKALGNFPKAFDILQPCRVSGLVADGAEVGCNVRTISGAAATTRTATISIADPAVFSASAHGLVKDDAVRLTTTGDLPTGLATGKIYYVLQDGLTADAFKLSATAGGPAIATSGTQSGTHTVAGPIEPYLYLAGGAYVDIDGFSARNCGTAIATTRPETRMSSLLIDSCAIGIDYASSAPSGGHENAVFLNTTTPVRVNGSAFPTSSTLVFEDGLSMVRARSIKQRLETNFNAGAFEYLFRSDPAAAKKVRFRSTTDESNTPKAAGLLGFVFDVLGTQAFDIDSDLNIVLGALAQLAADATNGFTYIPTIAAAPSGTPTAKTGKVALAFEPSSNKLWIYTGGAWRYATLT